METEGFSWAVREEAFVVSFSSPHRIMSWAPLHGGVCQAEHVMNCQISRSADRQGIRQQPQESPAGYLQRRAHHLGLVGTTVGMMTGVKLERLTQYHTDFASPRVSCFATVGCGNVLAVGDQGDYLEDVPSGTINLIVICNQPLTLAAMVEAVEITTEAKVRALYEAGVKSVVSGLPATGTGTDCVAIACPLQGKEHRYCGKHTKLGELVGRATFMCIAEGLRVAQVS
ncbi:MAG: adenosylcobinamide amidohydrolase [Deltaproteobacteria bacterium]|nr:adenosylcobinamide amidohydrolase [Deltaproteobacteria bacterium]